MGFHITFKWFLKNHPKKFTSLTHEFSWENGGLSWGLAWSFRKDCAGLEMPWHLTGWLWGGYQGVLVGQVIKCTKFMKVPNFSIFFWGIELDANYMVTLKDFRWIMQRLGVGNIITPAVGMVVIEPLMVVSDLMVGSDLFWDVVSDPPTILHILQDIELVVQRFWY